MNPIKSVIAFFQFKGKPMEMEVSSARISRGTAYLNPADEPDSTFIVHADTIKIILEDVPEDGVAVRPRSPKDNTSDGDSEPGPLAEPTPPKQPKSRRGGRAASEADFDFLTKHSFSTGFYPSERDEIVAGYKTQGAKRDEYLLACVRAASPKKIEAELKKLRKEREALQETET